jgi:hypothetical protein
MDFKPTSVRDPLEARRWWNMGANLIRGVVVLVPIPAVNIFQMLLIVITRAHAAGDRSKDATASIFGISIGISAAFDYPAASRSNR